MPGVVNMPELHELPPEKDGGDRNTRKGHWGRFLKGFVAAALIFGTFLAAQSWLASSHATDTDGSQIIEGN
jgi:hypothetical protein